MILSGKFDKQRLQITFQIRISKSKSRHKDCLCIIDTGFIGLVLLPKNNANAFGFDSMTNAIGAVVTTAGGKAHIPSSSECEVQIGKKLLLEPPVIIREQQRAVLNGAVNYGKNKADP